MHPIELRLSLGALQSGTQAERFGMAHKSVGILFMKSHNLKVLQREGVIVLGCWLGIIGFERVLW